MFVILVYSIREYLLKYGVETVGLDCWIVAKDNDTQSYEWEKEH